MPDDGSLIAPPPDPALRHAGPMFDSQLSARMLSDFLYARGWSFIEAHPVQALYRPTRQLIVRYIVRAIPPKGFPRYLAICARTRQVPRALPAPPDDFEKLHGLANPLEIDDDLVLWVYPYDPALPGLPHAAHGKFVRAAAGFDPPAAVSVSPVAYRPGMRAAFRYTVLGSGGVRETMYGKVVDDFAFRRIFDAFESFAGTGIRMAAPKASEGIEGLALFPPLAGKSLRDCLTEGSNLPSPDRIIDLIERLAVVEWNGDPTPGAPDVQIRSAGHLLAHILPHRKTEIQDAYRALAERTSKPSPSGISVHGDFYEAQIFVTDDLHLGLIDMEDGGPGDPLMDAGNMLAHLTVLDFYAPEADGRPVAYRQILREALLEHMGGGEAELNWREAYGLFMLATGPFRVLRPNWPEETEIRLDSALDLLRAVPAAS